MSALYWVPVCQMGDAESLHARFVVAIAGLTTHIQPYAPYRGCGRTESVML